MTDWTQTIALMITIIGGAYYIHCDIKEDMKSQTARTDKLYEMFCEIQKETSQKFYDLLKGKK